MRAWLLGAALAVAFVGPSQAALFTIDGGTAYVLPSTGGSKAYRNLSSGAAVDPWIGGTSVQRGATITFSSHAKSVLVTFLGEEAGYANTFHAGGAKLFENGKTAAGATATMSVGDFVASLFKSNGAGGGFGLASDRVAVTYAGDVLQLGFNDAAKGDYDYDDMRLQAQVVPVPAALPLLGTALAGLWGYRRVRQAKA